MKLKYYGGSGFSYSNKNGKYEVRYKELVKKFTDLEKAKKFFDSLDEEKAIWDVSGLSELLSCYVEDN